MDAGDAAAAEGVRNGPRLSLLIRMGEDQSFSSTAVRLWWLGLLLLHLVGGLFFALVCCAYSKMPGLAVTTFLDFYQVGMNSKHYHAIALAHGAIAVLHGLSALAMVSRSVRNRRLTFRGNYRARRESKATNRHRGQRKPGNSLTRCFTAVFGRRGVFGAQGPYYDLLLLIRETIETTLQTTQGLRMSQNIPRRWLNRFYVTLLVLSCWSTAFVHHMFRHNKTKMRLVALLSDCLLDLVTSVGVSLLLVVSYVEEFDVATGNFNILRWFQDQWLVNSMNEFNIILVRSWGDLATRMVFAVSMLSNLNTMEGLMTVAVAKGNRQAPTQPRGASIAPFETPNPRIESRIHVVQVWTDRLASSKALRLAFFSWGVVILGLHIHAEANEMLPQCLVQVHPWGVARPACSLVLLNCVTDNTDGDSAYSALQWSQLDANSLKSLLVRNCPRFQVPSILTSFRSLTTFKVYNSTILEWGEDAAFSQDSHPVMHGAMFMRVNFTNGELPLGLLSARFPPSLNIIGFVVSNLRVLPDDLHLKWPRYSAIHLDSTQFTEFPETVWKISPSILIMPCTPLESVPKELFGLESMWYLDLAGTKLSALPEDVPVLTNPLLGINLGGTNISSFPSWIDPWLQRMANPIAPPLAASGTPYCLELEEIFSGTRTDFSGVTPRVTGTPYSVLMDRSQSNRAFLTSAVNCQPSFLYRYALVFEDQNQHYDAELGAVTSEAKNKTFPANVYMESTKLTFESFKEMDEARGEALEERFSPIVIRFYWACFVLLHVAGFAYYGFTAWCYWNLPGTRLDVWLSLYRLGMEEHHDRIVAVFMGIAAMIHGLYIVWMIFWSFKKRQLVFAVYNVVHMPKCILRLLPATRRNSRSVHPNGISHNMYRAFCTRDGLLGVDGQYFDSILFCREVVATALQTHQAYRMSVLLPRVQINRVYVALLVASCWTTALVHSVYHANSVKRRVWSLVSDCVLDTVTAMGISTVLLATYINDFDFKISGFPFYKWYEDTWVVHATSEFQIILVTSWKDLCTRMVFAVSLLSDLDSIKMVMRVRRRKRTSSTTSSGKRQGHHATLVAPYFASAKLRSGPGVNILRRRQTKDMLSRISQLVFFVWGLAVLILHLYAETAPELSQCWMQVRPWITKQSSCSLLVLDCHDDKLQGKKSEVVQQWSAFDPASVTRAVVRHCPALEMPVTLTTFSNLNAIKLYNSTVVTWDDSAALTQLSHPKLMTLFLVRVNLPDGNLPVGLHSSDFPQSLGDIEFCCTNLRTLPDDIDLKWPQAGSIYIEASQLIEVPSSLARLAPFDLSLSMNPISTLPVELFEQESVGYLSFGGTLISQLPASVTKLSSQLHEINLSYNNLSFFWPWIDPIVDQSQVPPLKMAGTPYCSDLDRIFAGEQATFSVVSPASEASKAMSVLADASVGNWDTLKKAVSCDEQDTTWYPIDLEDEYSSVSYPGQY